MVHVHGHEACIRCHSRQVSPGRLAGQGDDRLDLGVIGKCLGTWQIDCGTRIVDAVRTLPGRVEALRDAMGIAPKECGRIDNGRARVRINIRKAPDNRLCKRLIDRLALVGVVAICAVPQIVLDKQHLGATAYETYDSRGAELTTIDAEIVRADAAG